MTGGGERADHAIVVGGGIAGLAAAGVLAQRFAKVSVVEQDHCSDPPDARRGVPQGRHQHLLLMRGQLILEELFPGIRGELLVAGAVPLDLTRDVAWLMPAGWALRTASGQVALGSSRSLLESAMRRRVAARRGVDFREGVRVSGLTTSPDRATVTGIALEDGEEVRARVVVDATGRGSRAPGWLETHGYARPDELVVNAHIGYASRTYRLARPLPTGLRGALVRSTPPTCTRGGVIMPVEGGRVVVTLAGFDHDYPPTDEQGFLSFALTLRSRLIWDAIRDAEPCSPIAGSRATANRLRRYERLRRLPDGLFVLGDAVCAFNPVFQQGMSTALLGAVTLRTVLQGPRRNRSRRFQRALARVNRTPWCLATAQDVRWSRAGGPPIGLRGRILQGSLGRVGVLSTSDANARMALFRVVNMTAPPRTLLRPQWWTGRARPGVGSPGDSARRPRAVT